MHRIRHKRAESTAVPMVVVYLILGVLTFVLVVAVGMRWVTYFLSDAPDPDLNSLKNLVAEMSQGITVMKTSNLNSYSITFPFSLQKSINGDENNGDKINKFLRYDHARNKLCLFYDTPLNSKVADCKNLPKEITNLVLTSYDQQSVPLNNHIELHTPFPSLMPYTLTITRVNKTYSATIGPDPTVDQSGFAQESQPAPDDTALV